MPGSFGMLLDADFLARYPRAKTLCNLWLRSQILADCDPNVFQRLFARRSLTVAPWKVVTPNGEALVGFHKRYVIGHALKMPHLENSIKIFLSYADLPFFAQDRLVGFA